MKVLILTFLLLSQPGASPYIAMDEVTLENGGVPVLIYVLGCGEWSDFSFTVNQNAIQAEALVSSAWFSCQVDPLPPKHWNRVPLIGLTAGAYTLNLQLSDDAQNSVNETIEFSVRGGPQAVPATGLSLTILLCFFVAVFGMRKFKLMHGQNT